jgi:mannose-6-phosphate isomerase-like protein (cupin superfamily)
MNGDFLGRDDDAVSIAPQLHTVLFEDERVRVVRLVVPPCAKAAMHWHPRSLSYILSPGKVRRTRPDGTVTEAKLIAGTVTASPERLHAVENVGESTVEIIEIEFKN